MAGYALLLLSSLWLAAFAYEADETRIGKTYWIGQSAVSLIGRQALLLPKDYFDLKYGAPLKVKRIIKEAQYGFDDLYEIELESGQTGYILTRMFSAAQSGGSIVPYDPKKRDQAHIATAKKAEEKRVSAIKNKKWPPAIEQAAINKKIILGMTDEQIILSWGKPQNVNRSVGNWGIHEQWIYGSTYLFLENGKLRSWQESR